MNSPEINHINSVNSMLQHNDFVVYAKLILALEKFYTKDKFLVENDVNERAITHKLAEYLQELFPENNVDCEYNRVGVKDEKENVNEEYKKVLMIYKKCDKCEKENSQYVYPDIIVHTRGSAENNILVVEAKKDLCEMKCDSCSNKAERWSDCEKLKKLTSSKQRILDIN